jgi:hypothetical protein
MALTANKYFRALSVQETAVDGYTFRVDFTWQDLYNQTIGTNATATFTVGAVKAASELVAAHLHVGTAFSDLDDTAFNTTTFDFGDTGSATRYFSGVETNVNGSYVVDSTYTSRHIYTADDTLKVVFHSMSGKDLTNIDNGKLYLECTFLRYSGYLKNVPELPAHI